MQLILIGRDILIKRMTLSDDFTALNFRLELEIHSYEGVKSD